MTWIKRNLIFVIGSLVALLLMGGAGVYTWSRWQGNAKASEELGQAYEELKRLNNQNPHPGDGKKVDNIKLARQQQEQARAYLKTARERVQPIAPIPPSAGGVELKWGSPEGWTNLTRAEFGSALRLTIAQLQREASNHSVAIPANYGFSFEAQRQRTFEVGNLSGLAQQLGEVKAICGVLNAAKINSLVSLRRERVSTEDNAGPLSDYLSVNSETNELAVLTPYEITFYSFSAELAAVVAGFANSSHAMLVKAVNVKPAPVVAIDPTQQPGVVPSPVYVMPPPPMLPSRTLPQGEMSSRAEFNRRYGLGGGGKDSLMSRYQQQVAPPPPVAVAPPTAPGASRSGLQPMLDERQLEVTITLRIVKMLPPK